MRGCGKSQQCSLVRSLAIALAAAACGPAPASRSRRESGATARRAILASFVAFSAGCAEPAWPADTQLYGLALAAAETELRLSPPLRLHPFPSIIDAAGLRAAQHLEFNAFDSATVPRLVREDPTRYRLCTPDAGGSCELAEGEAALVVSNLLDVDGDAIGLVLMVQDFRTGARVWRYYTVRIKHTLGRWEVVEFRPSPGVAIGGRPAG
jgi:hypothetical protein